MVCRNDREKEKKRKEKKNVLHARFGKKSHQVAKKLLLVPQDNFFHLPSPPLC
jgi:hypothetical protein